MKKVVLAILTIVVALSAVEWDIEQVTTTDDKTNSGAKLTLDAEGFARVFFGQHDTTRGTFQGDLRVSSNVSGSWVEKVVTVENDSFNCVSECIAVDSKGNTYVAFISAILGMVSDIYLACDSSGEFELMKLPYDGRLAFDLALVVDNEDNIHLIFTEPHDFPRTGITYGYLNKQGFHTEIITDSLDLRIGFYFDLVVDKGNTPHVIYVGSDSTLCHASPSSLYTSGWMIEQISDSPLLYPAVANISAAINNSDHLHVAYRPGDGIRYLTNESGEWREEIISEDSDDYYPCIVVDSKGEVHIMYWGIVGSYYVNKMNGWEVKEKVPSGYLEDGRFFDVDASGHGHYVTYNIYEDLTGEVFYVRSMKPLISISESPTETEPLDIEVRSGVIYFNFSHTGSIRLDLYDAVGRHVDQLASGNYPAGEHTLTINTTGLSAGVYFVRGELNGRSASAKFVLTK